MKKNTIGLISKIKGVFGSREKFNLTNPKDWKDFFGWGLTNSGVTVNKSTSQGISAFSLANRLIAESVSTLPVHKFRKTSTGRELIEDAPSYVVAKKPNNYQTSLVFRETLQSYCNLTGNGYAYIQKGENRQIEAMHIIPTEQMYAVQKSGDDIYYKFKDSQNWISSEYIFHIKQLGNGIIGMDPISQHRENLGISLASQKFGATYFGNGATPSGILSTDKEVADEVRAAMSRSWKESTSGDRSNSVTVLDRGFKYQQVSVSPEQAQFLQTRNFQVSEIARITNIPPHKLYDLSKATFSNIEHQSIAYLVDSIRPWLKKWEAELNDKILREDEKAAGFYYKFNMDALLRGDTESRSKFYESGMKWGYFNIDDIRRMENMNDLPDGMGKKHYFPLNYTELSKIGINEQ